MIYHRLISYIRLESDREVLSTFNLVDIRGRTEKVVITTCARKITINKKKTDTLRSVAPLFPIIIDTIRDAFEMRA